LLIQSPSTAMRFVAGALAALAAMAPAGPALAQSAAQAAAQGVVYTGTPSAGQGITSATTQISLDSPLDASQVAIGAHVDIGGWAIDTEGPDTGVDLVQVYLDGPMDGGGTFVGPAHYGHARPDVAVALGSTSYTNSGFDYVWIPSSLSSGMHTLYVYAHTKANGWQYVTVSIIGPNAPNSGQPQNVGNAPAPNQQGAGAGGQTNAGSSGQTGGSAAAPNQGQNAGPYSGPYPGPYAPGPYAFTPYGGTYLNNWQTSGQGYGSCFGVNAGQCGGGYGYGQMPPFSGPPPMNPLQPGAPFMGF